MNSGDVVALVGLVLGGGGVVALIQARAVNRHTNADTRKTDAEAEVTLGGGWLALYTAQQSELNGMRERLVVVEKEAETAKEHEQECLRRIDELENHARTSLATVETRVMSLLDTELAKRGVVP